MAQNPFQSFYMNHGQQNRICGCQYVIPSVHHVKSAYVYPTHVQPLQRHCLPMVSLSAHATVLSTTTRTTLTQTFQNPHQDRIIEHVDYQFPVWDGVSVIHFKCVIGSRVLIGIVKEKAKARQVYDQAVSRGEFAGLLEQHPAAADVFTTMIGNVPAGEKVVVNITFTSELKHDSEIDGIRYTIPTFVAPRYGLLPSAAGVGQKVQQGQLSESMEIIVDVHQEGAIRSLLSPSHPIKVTLGNISTDDAIAQENPTFNRASATLSLGKAELDKDFVLQILAKGVAEPVALLEKHPHIPNHRALMVSLVPKFKLKPISPELVFCVDRSGSMSNSVDTLIKALRVFLKSLPVGVKFNICSYGSTYSFLWSKSQSYNQGSLKIAEEHVNGFSANFGGTETFEALKATINNRYKDIPLEVMLLTDGDVWGQQLIFDYLNKEVSSPNGKSIRVFTMGIGNGVSHSLIEGIARAGNGFSQAVQLGERLDTKVVRMLKGALSPHITNYSLEIQYEGNENDEEFDLIERIQDSLVISLPEIPQSSAASVKPISLFDHSVDVDEDPNALPDDDDGQRRYSHLPAIDDPKLIQAPHKVRPLFPFERSVIYILMGSRTSSRQPKSVILKANSPQGPLELQVPVRCLEQPGETFHQLAARKAISELEEGRGWIEDAKDEGGVPLKERLESQYQDMVEREAVRLGVKFQVAGKWSSFVAVESNTKELEEKALKTKQQGSKSDKQERSATTTSENVSPTRSQPAYSTTNDQSLAGSRQSEHALGSANDTMSDVSSIISSATFLSTSSFGDSTKYSTMAYDSNKFLAGAQHQRASPQSFGQPIVGSGGLFGGPVALSSSGSGSLFGSASGPASFGHAVPIPPLGPQQTGGLLSSGQQLSATYIPTGGSFGPGTPQMSSPSPFGRPINESQSAQSSLFGRSAQTSASKVSLPQQQQQQQQLQQQQQIQHQIQQQQQQQLTQPQTGFRVAHTTGTRAVPNSANAMNGILESQRKAGPKASDASNNPMSAQLMYSNRPGGLFGYVPQVPSKSRVRQVAGTRTSPDSTPATDSMNLSGQGWGRLGPQELNMIESSKESAEAMGDDDDWDLDFDTVETEAREGIAQIPNHTLEVHPLDHLVRVEGVPSLIEPPTKKVKVNSGFAARETAAAQADELAGFSENDKLHRLIALQSFEGYWNLEDQLAKILEAPQIVANDTPGQLTSRLSLKLSKVDIQRIWATALAVAYFAVELGGDEASWELVVEKARAWLETQLGGEDGVNSWIGAAKELVRN